MCRARRGYAAGVRRIPKGALSDGWSGKAWRGEAALVLLGALTGLLIGWADGCFDRRAAPAVPVATPSPTPDVVPIEIVDPDD